jgi:hypothetical protein
MRAGRPTSRKIRAMPAWITLAVRDGGEEVRVLTEFVTPESEHVLDC